MVFFYSDKGHWPCVSSDNDPRLPLLRFVICLAFGRCRPSATGQCRAVTGPFPCLHPLSVTASSICLLSHKASLKGSALVLAGGGPHDQFDDQVRRHIHIMRFDEVTVGWRSASIERRLAPKPAHPSQLTVNVMSLTVSTSAPVNAAITILS